MTTKYQRVRPLTWNVGNDGVREKHSPLDWLSRAGIGLLAFFANSTEGAAGGSPGADQAPHAMQDVPIPDDKCCNLARPDRECQYTGDKSNYTCPEGFQKTFWPCCEGTRLIGCGECSSGPSCFDDPWDCSIWWWMDISC